MKDYFLEKNKRGEAMSLIPLIGRIANERLTFRDSRQIRSTSCGPLHGEKPGRGGHS